MSAPSDGSDKWTKVKVKDEYYVLKESISDTSSDEDDAKDGDNRSGSDSDSDSDSSSSDGDCIESRRVIKEEPKVPATPSTPAAVLDGPFSAPTVVAKEVQSPEYVSLRNRENSGAASSAAGRKRSDSVTADTPERWRMRLWPSKAITAFCRIITRCKPPDSTPGVRLGSTNTSKHKGGKVELIPHWRTSELSKVPTVFINPADHSSVFFLLTVEECREAVTKAEDTDSFVFETAARYTKSGQNDSSGRNGWLEGEITAIIAESPSGALPKACDPRLGSVWVIAAAITSSAPLPSAGKSGPPGRQGQMFGKEGLDLSGGDLMVLHSPRWAHPILGIIQPWDPDYDIKYGINFSINQSTYISTQQAPGRAGASVQVVNILVCVDQSDALAEADIGGWAAQGSIMSGVRFSMAPIGNVMTYIRECQALMSLKLINKSLQSMILSGAFFAPSAASDAPPVSIATSSSAARVPVSAPKAVLSPRKLALEQPVRCPENIPMPLWLALSRQYNESQLRAICMVSRRYQEKHLLGASAGSAAKSAGAPVESSLSLLQGPPGTGKTRTILGIVSVFLAGALNLTAQGTTRIIAGASLYGETAGENSTKWSDEKLTRPRGGSISVITTANGDTAGKRTRVLICAPSNTAVDEVVYRLVTQGVLDSKGKRMGDLCVVRIGQPCRDEYLKQGIETFGKSGRGQQALNASDENMVKVVERATLDTLVEERRRALMAADTRHQGGAAMKVADIRKQILDQADVVCSTLSGAGSQPMLEVVLRMTGFKFDAVIIDEAAQAVEPSSLIPFKYNPQAVVLVGDPCQLPATVFSRTAKHANYNQSLFQRLQVAGYPVLMLETQYRMHPAIADYPSQRFYQGRLLTGSQLITSDSHSKPYHNDPSGRFRPFVFHNVPYSIETNEGTSICNREEAMYVVDLFEELVRKYPDHRGGIGIIAPYRAQRRLLNSLFRERFGNAGNPRKGGSSSTSLPPIWDLDTEISTVDGFQGREKAIVIFSCVRAPKQRGSQAGSSHPSEDNLLRLAESALADAPVLVESRSMSELSSAGSNTESAFNEPDAHFRSIGFLKEWQRLNVAITRSRYALWVVGHGEVLRCDSEWRHLIEYSKSKGAYYTAPAPGRIPGMSAQSDTSRNNGGGGGQQQNRPKQEHQSSHHKNKSYHKKHPNDKPQGGGQKQGGQTQGNPQPQGGQQQGGKRSGEFATRPDGGEKRVKGVTGDGQQRPPSAPPQPPAQPPALRLPSPAPAAAGSSDRAVTGSSGPFSFQAVAIKLEPPLGRPPLPPGRPPAGDDGR